MPAVDHNGHLVDRIRQDRLIGTFVKSRDPTTTEAIAVAGYDFVIADLEHSVLAMADVENIVRACDRHGVAVVARIDAGMADRIGTLLDVGVSGIQVSNVTRSDNARAVQLAAHYPPRGVRSLSLANRAAGFGTITAKDHLIATAGRCALIGQIESVNGLANLPAILDSAVFDLLFLGPTDLSVDLGHPGDLRHPTVHTALDTAAQMTLAHGTALGIFCATVEEAQQWARRGATYLAVSSDLAMLADTAMSTARLWRSSAVT
ncbi:MAG TPA: aldolase/citrate lyase family protein [Pseudonocardiaceae bacterium]|jgi:4-hydroxy-2-oxoheptanedioate aldolase|nr:aldolase/citrate lyase family protein [Pseudonocardiaceae bacterium]